VSRKIVAIVAISLLAGMVAIPAQAQSGDPPPQVLVHIVQRDETMFSVARRYGLTVDAITHANGIPDPRKIYVGQRLVIPFSQEDITLTETVPHVIQAGETLASIARRYHTTWQALIRINNLISPNTVYAGQVIQVPRSNRPICAANCEERIPDSSIGGGIAYIVHPEDTMFRIALRYDVPPWTLAAVSHAANPALIYPGQELTVPSPRDGPLPAPFVSVEIQPLPVTQGTTLIIAVPTTEPVTLKGELFGQGIYFAEERGVYYGLVGVHVFTEPGLYELALEAIDARGQSTAVTTGVLVEAGRFGYERIDVPVDRTSLLDPDVVAQDRERFNSVRHIFSPERSWELPFQRPCTGAISAYFGAHRSYNGGPYTSYHSGVDFRAPRGTPVHAAAGGTVVLAESMALWGNAVVIDHGWGLLTGYGHLSTIEVQTGQQVLRGDQIGKVGNTGLSTGAHLHWEMWVGGNSVDGLQWLEEPHHWPDSKWLAIGG